MIDRTDDVLGNLARNGYNPTVKYRDNYGGVVIHTNDKDLFLKNDTRPWYIPINVSFQGPAVAVNANSFRRFIQPFRLDFLYSWGEIGKIYHVDGNVFSKDAELTEQNDGDEVYAYPLNKTVKWDITPKEKQTDGQMTLD